MGGGGVKMAKKKRKTFFWQDGSKFTGARRQIDHLMMSSGQAEAIHTHTNTHTHKKISTSARTAIGQLSQGIKRFPILAEWPDERKWRQTIHTKARVGKR